MFRYICPDDARLAGYVFVSDRFLMVIDSALGAEGAQRVWEATSAPGALLEDVLEVLVDIGVETLPAFALVELIDARTRAVALAVRGSAVVDLHGSTHSRLVGGGIRTWVEGSAEQIARLTLALDDVIESDAPSLPLGRGVVRADRLEWIVAGVPQPAVAEAAPAPVAASAHANTVAIDRMAIAAYARAADGDAEPAEPAAEPAEPAAGPRRAAPEVPSPPSLPSPPRPQPTRELALRMADRLVPLHEPVVFGRNPQATAHPGSRIEVLRSPRREISQTHLEVSLDGDWLLVRDLRSTNGTIVRAPDGSAQLLRDGAAARVAPGTLLDIGDGAIALFSVVA